MSAELATEAGPHATKAVSSHPLAPLSTSEITTAASIIKASWPAHTDLHFKVVTLQEPPKVEVLRYLEAEHAGKPRPEISRKAFLNYYIRNTNKFHEATIDLTSRRVEHNVLLGPFVHANGDGDEIVAIEKIVLSDEGVQAEIAKLQLPEGTVVISVSLHLRLVLRSLLIGSTGPMDIWQRWHKRRGQTLPVLPIPARSKQYVRS